MESGDEVVSTIGNPPQPDDHGPPITPPPPFADWMSLGDDDDEDHDCPFCEGIGCNECNYTGDYE